YGNDRYQESVELIEHALKLEPEHKSAYNDLGRSLLALGKMERAEEAFKKAIAIDPFSPYAYNNLGRVCLSERRFEEGEKWFLKQIEIDPLDPYAHKNLGEMLVQRAEFARALPVLEKAAKITPKDADLFVNLGMAQMQLAQPAEAQESFKRAVELSPTPSTWYTIASYLALITKNLEIAREYAESAVAMVSAQLRNTRLETVKTDDLRQVGFLAVVWDTLGWVHFKRGDLRAAEKYLKAAWQLSQEGDMADHLGQLYERLGKLDLAKEYYAFSTIDTFPPHEGRKHLAALIGEAKMEGYVDSVRTRPGELRTYTVPAATGEGTADFFVSLAPGPRVVETRFISGEPKLKGLSEALKQVKFVLDFPSESDTRVIRRGILSCSEPPTVKTIPPKTGMGPAAQMPPAAARGSSCVFVLLETDTIQPF
ncbi:MAG TPA: tetratricopeptide repeat protein, partial [Candidatus Polarisedimenticolia bacterium]|nr:tetratricopeptide repeat protein [Candidatus Polarisedimenticolia bacterium]